MRKSSKAGKGSPKLEQAPVPEAVDDVKVKAVNEMMERIKHGVVLRPVKGQDTKRFVPKQTPASEEKHQESAMEELKGILDAVKKSPSRSFQETSLVKKDSELEVILRRRRKQACEPASADDVEGQISKVSSFDSLNGRHSSDSGKDTDRPSSSSLSGSDSSPRISSDLGTETNGSKQTAAVCPSLSEKESSEPVINCLSACELMDEEQESKHHNDFSHPAQHKDPQVTISSSADSTSAANSSLDAEC